MRKSAIHLMLVCVVALSACDSEAPEAEVSKSPVGPVPAAEQRPGDPRAGYEALVNNAYVTCGIPYAAYREFSEPPSAESLLADRKGPNAELPYPLTFHRTAEGVELVVSNCLTCHAEYFNGELIVGLGNESRDFTRDLSAFVESVGAYVTDEKDAREWQKWADRWNAIAPYVRTETRGVNAADNLTLALFAHRDPETLKWSNEPLMAPPGKHVLPVSVPPWWRMSKKHAMFYHGGGRGDHAPWMMTASTLCTDTVEEAKQIDSYFPHVQAFIYSLEAPPYPFDIDRKLAKKGRPVFEQYCSGCHGTYGENSTYPNLIIALEEIGTDPELALSATSKEDRFIQWFNRSFYGQRAQAAPAPGYYAPPLDGVWATAPYLHNGSVPTVAGLLNSAERPATWARSFDSKDYDQKALGWRYTVPGSLPEDREARARIYDTGALGYSNQGHAYGDKLTPDERRAVIEYLKTL